MANLLRQIVSGDKSRFKDDKLGLELDLVYVTEQYGKKIIIMGYPAAGVEGWYRNRREDAKKFLDHRHGQRYWVFNFCPIRENSYPASVFDGRVSRYPFPDHHAPPLAILPLAAREMRQWLEGAPDRVIVLHCKAGKGRSGTLACAYLLASDDTYVPAKDSDAKEQVQLRAKEIMESMPGEDQTDPTLITVPSVAPSLSSSCVPSPTSTPVRSAAASPVPSAFSGPLKEVLDLHTSKRMKTPEIKDKTKAPKIKQGVSIPSQRRYLYYWSLLLSHLAPPTFWTLNPAPPEAQVRLTQIQIRMKDIKGVRKGILSAANFVLGKSGLGRAEKESEGQVWVSLARYDDTFVKRLEDWEKKTRAEDGHMGRRKKAADIQGVDNLMEGDKWDKDKMVKSFARLGAVGDGAILGNAKDAEKITTYHLHPLSDASWATLRHEIQNDEAQLTASSPDGLIPVSENNSALDVSQSTTTRGIILNAHREVRVKLYMGQVFMGWIWFIPAFHMVDHLTTITFTRKEIDFPLGVGAALVDVEISLEAMDATVPNAHAAEREDTEPAGGIGATFEATTTASGLAELVNMKQAGDD